ncbi:hypothetical protein M3J09_003405 [Ascochyta lentis]
MKRSVCDTVRDEALALLIRAEVKGSFCNMGLRGQSFARLTVTLGLVHRESSHTVCSKILHRYRLTVCSDGANLCPFTGPSRRRFADAHVEPVCTDGVGCQHQRNPVTAFC